MRSGDEFLVQRRGLKLTPKQAANLGLLDGARASARWVEGENASTHSKLSGVTEDLIDPTCQGPNLVLSPIHPDRWPAVFAVEIRLQRTPGALRTALAKLRDLGVNVLTIQSVAAGFGVSVVTAICELPRMTLRVRRRLQKLDEDVARSRRAAVHAAAQGDTDQQRDVEHRIQFMRASAMRDTGLDQLVTGCVVGSTLRIWDAALRSDGADRIEAIDAVGRINGDDDPGYVPFLHRRTRQMGLQPWFLDRGRIEDLAELSERAIEMGLLAPTNPNLNERSCLSEQFARYYQAVMREDGTDRLERLYEIEIEEAVVRAREKHLRKDQGQADDGDRYLIRESWRSSGYEPIRVFPLISLAYARHWVVPERAELDFQYRAASNLLEFQPDDDVHHDQLLEDFASIAGIDRDELDEPVVSLGYFHPQERYLRLRLLRGWYSREFAAQLDLSYSWRGKEGHRAPSGLLEQVCTHLQRRGFNVERIENSLIDVTEHYEEGRVRMIFTKSRPSARPSRSQRHAELGEVESGVHEQIRLAREQRLLTDALDIHGVSVLELNDSIALRVGP